MSYKDVYLIEVGILLTEEDEYFDCYNTVYNHKYGFYDEGQYYLEKKEKAIEEAKAYVEEGVENTYAIVSLTFLDEDIDIDDEDLTVQGEDYLMENVVYSIAKINGKIVENFLEKEK